MSYRRMVLTVVLSATAFALAAILAGPASAQVHFRKCGKVRAIGVEVLASKVSCRKAIKIVTTYKRVEGTGLPKKIPGFPGWECSSGSGAGSCSRGSYAPGAPQIEFPYLEGPGDYRFGGFGANVSRTALEFAGSRPPCTVRALAKGLRHGGLRGQVSDAFGCAGRFAWAGVVVHHDGTADEATVLFRAGRGLWHPVSRARFCENGEVPKKIYQPACESN